MKKSQADFSKILEQWEGRGLDEKSLAEKRTAELEEDRKKRIRREQAEAKKKVEEMSPQDRLDLHGLTRDEALDALQVFLKSCFKRGLKKVLVIHGKGYHSAGEPVLKRAVRSCLESSRLVRSFSGAPAKWGGGGAVVVFLRETVGENENSRK
jgi:DNA-nicking Smr family endonuclease